MNKIIIYTDDDGFYGSSSSAEIEKIDHAASYEKYKALISQAIRQNFPVFASLAKIVFEYGPTMKTVKVIMSENTFESYTEAEEIEEEISEIVDRIYNAGEFWTHK